MYLYLLSQVTQRQPKNLESKHIMSKIRQNGQRKARNQETVKTDLTLRDTRLKGIKVWVDNAVKSRCDFLLPVVHYVRDDGGKEAEQHDRRAGIHDRVQKLPRVGGEWQHLLQILRWQKSTKKIRQQLLEISTLKQSMAKK